MDPPLTSRESFFNPLFPLTPYSSGVQSSFTLITCTSAVFSLSLSLMFSIVLYFKRVGFEARHNPVWWAGGNRAGGGIRTEPMGRDLREREREKERA